MALSFLFCSFKPAQTISMKESEQFTLKALNGLVRDRLKAAFPDNLMLIAEISELSVNRNGHCYMELIEKEVDSDAIIARARAIIWSYTYRVLKPYFEHAAGLELQSGLKVLLTVQVEFHEAYGYSLVVKDIDPSYTLGEWALRKREVVLRLEKEGMLEMNRTLPMPMVPRSVAIISSPTAAGYGDFMHHLNENELGIHYYTRLFPASMQGADTERSVIDALEQINQCTRLFDVVVIIRGGGAQAELNAFNSYLLGLHVAQFPLPVLSGIGHERDETVVDMVAWQGFKTPTAVADFLMAQSGNFIALLDGYANRLRDLASGGLHQSQEKLLRFSRTFSPRVVRFLGEKRMGLQQSGARLRHVVARGYERERSRMEGFALKNNLLRPEHILQRGYSLTLCRGRIVTSASGLEKGARLTTLMRDGKVDSIVDEVNIN